MNIYTHENWDSTINEMVCVKDRRYQMKQNSSDQRESDLSRQLLVGFLWLLMIFYNRSLAISLCFAHDLLMSSLWFRMIFLWTPYESFRIFEIFFNDFLMSCFWCSHEFPMIPYDFLMITPIRKSWENHKKTMRVNHTKIINNSWARHKGIMRKS